MLNILKAFTSSKWGEQKELIVSTFKAIICFIWEYANTTWSLIISNTNIKKTANHLKHSFVNQYWLHTRYEHSTPTQKNQGPSNGHPSQTSCYST